LSASLRHIRLDSVDSTNTWARQEIARLAEGTIVTARHQTGGRGRGSNRWVCPPGGGALFSLVIDRRKEWDFSDLGRLSVDAAEITAKFIRDKWNLEAVAKVPNDVMVFGRKICGILVEEAADKIIVGIGLNTDLDPALLNIGGEATSVYALRQQRSDNEGIALELAGLLLERFTTSKPGPLEDR